MSGRVPPRAVRRLIVDPLWIPIALVLILVLLVVAALADLLAPLTPRRRLLRVALLAVVYLWMDLGLLVRCVLMWLRHPRAGRRDERQWRLAHADLLGRSLTRLMNAARRLFGYRVERVGRPTDAGPTVPVIVLARHAGPGDSFTLVHLLVTQYHRSPKVVLKELLQWDPGLDVVLTRLACHFLPSTTGAGDDRAAALGELATTLDDGDALLLFPEGGNWTPRRHRRAVLRLLRAGRGRQARRVQERTHVLPVRPAGTVAALSARADTDVVIVAHCGLDTLVNPRQVWRALPLDGQPMRVRSWRHPAATVPRDEAGITAWLDERWSDVDEWVHTQRRVDTEHAAPGQTRGSQLK
ncbi:MAG: 1-acyl-sn-glycerol-3-phosphate acyltransferase [Jatrophihabitantaceae bacterium]